MAFIISSIAYRPCGNAILDFPNIPLNIEKNPQKIRLPFAVLYISHHFYFCFLLKYNSTQTHIITNHFYTM